MNKLQNNANPFPSLTEMLKMAIDDIAEKVLKEGQPVIVLDEYSWHTYVISLLAKQVNLCDSCILLLENGMEQEAYLLARSQLNNMLWIKYLCGDTNNERVKEYYYQNHIDRVITNNKIKEFIDKSNHTAQTLNTPQFIQKLDQAINASQSILSQEKIPIKIKTVFSLTQGDEVLAGLYLTMYHEGSQFDHSDVSVTNKYRKAVIDGYDENRVFAIDLSESNPEIWLAVYRCSLFSMFFSIDSLQERIDTKENHLYNATPVSEAAYNKKDFEEIRLKLGKCQNMLDEVSPISSVPRVK
jgi:hypothetical protein